MFTLTGSGIRNILFDARLRNPAQLHVPTQLTFCSAQFASKKVHSFHFFPAHLINVWKCCIFQQNDKKLPDCFWGKNLLRVSQLFCLGL